MLSFQCPGDSNLPRTVSATVTIHWDQGHNLRKPSQPGNQKESYQWQAQQP